LLEVDMTDKTVLLVEDETRLLKSTGRLLEDEFNIFKAINGRDAFDVLRQVHVDCAVIDVNLGDMNGFELVSKLRTRGKKTPVIMVSGRSLEMYKGMLQPLEISHCIQKPYEIEVLISMIKSITGQDNI